MSLSPRDSLFKEYFPAQVKAAFALLSEFNAKFEDKKLDMEKDREGINKIIISLQGNGPYITEAYHDTSTYYGQKNGDCREGIGIYRYESGAEYCGEWLQGVRAGIGKCDFTSGSLNYTFFILDAYHGNWSNGMRNGLGAFYYSKSNDRYCGEFKDDNREGFGNYDFGGGGKYLGEWIQNKRVGRGIMTNNEDQTYVGEWVRNKREGQGVYFLAGMLSHPSQKLFDYCGSWVNNKKQGIGYFLKDGEVVSGQFDDDNLVEVLTVDILPFKKCLVWNLEVKNFYDCGFSFQK